MCERVEKMDVSALHADFSQLECDGAYLRLILLMTPWRAREMVEA
jgi:hypothetical protein